MLGQEDLELRDSLGFVETIKQEGKNVLAGATFIILQTLILKHIAEPGHLNGSRESTLLLAQRAKGSYHSPD